MPPRFRSAVEAQIRTAQQRGAFDNLPGAGKPIPGLMEPDDPMWWIKGMIRREDVPVGAMLPPSLALRREVERLAETVRPLRTEKAVREHVQELNTRIRRWIHIPVGPQVVLGPVDVDEVTAAWRAERTPTREPDPAPPARQPRWWRRRP